MKTILVSAFSCTPNHGSEPGVGWNWPLLAAKNGYRVIVLTRTKLKDEIDKALRKEQVPNLSFVYCKSSKRLRKISIYLEYYFWQKQAWKVARKICQSQKIDYLWFLTMGSMILPNFIYRVKNIPLIWGPVGGGENVLPGIYNEWPTKYNAFYKRKEAIINIAKNVRWVKKLQDSSHTIILRTSMSRRLIYDRNQEKIIVASETFFNAKDFRDLDGITAKKDSNHFVFCFDGRLIASKNVLNFATAFRSICHNMPDAKLQIIGDGEQYDDIKKLCCDQIVLIGGLPRSETLQFVANCDCFCFPSLREGTSWSLAEAMYLGKPVICTDANGVGDLSENCGCLRVKIDEKTTNESMIEDFQRLILEMYSLGPVERENMGSLNKRRILVFYSEKAAAAKLSDWFK